MKLTRLALLLACAAYTLPLLADTKLKIFILNSDGGKVPAGEVIIKQDQLGDKLPKSFTAPGEFEDTIAGTERFSAYIQADNYWPAMLLSLSGKPEQQEVTVELRRLSEAKGAESMIKQVKDFLASLQKLSPKR